MNPAIRETASVGEIASRYPQTRELLEAMGIDYCCGGKYSLKEVCQKAGLSCQDITGRLQEIIERLPANQPSGKNWPASSLSELMQHILDVHHAYLKEQLPRLCLLSNKVYQAHHQHHGAMLQELKQTLENLRTDIEMHLAKEEQILFPLINMLEAFANHQGPKPQMHCGRLENPIHQMEYEHEIAGGFLAQMRLVTSGYKFPEDACASFKAFYEGLGELEKDLHEHIHLENNILFPKAILLDSQMDF